MSVITLSDEKAIEKFRMVNHKSVLYFTATWCPPCKAIAPVYEELSKKYPDVAFGKVDVDENSDAALDFEVKAVPTFVLFDGEDMKDKFSGADATLLEKHVQEL
jgi:thioredoxin 1